MRLDDKVCVVTGARCGDRPRDGDRDGPPWRGGGRGGRCRRRGGRHGDGVELVFCEAATARVSLARGVDVTRSSPGPCARSWTRIGARFGTHRRPAQQRGRSRDRPHLDPAPRGHRGGGLRPRLRGQPEGRLARHQTRDAPPLQALERSASIVNRASSLSGLVGFEGAGGSTARRRAR